jgi:transcription-repair coupling factor (superfamily II helicase)
VIVHGCSRNARPWLLAQLTSRGGPPWLWVLPDERSAETALEATRFYLSQATPAPTDPFAAVPLLFSLHQDRLYEDLSPDRQALFERMAVLFRLCQHAPPPLLITSVPALLRLTLPPQSVDSASLLIMIGQSLDRTEFTRSLVRAGYLNVPLVEDPGTFAIRGGVLDVFGPQLPSPIRIELLGDEVESLRTFDPTTQLTQTRLESAFIGPVREILQDDEHTQHAIQSINSLAAELDVSSHRLLEHRRALKEGVRYFGIEALLPAFYPTLASLFDYLPKDTRLFIDNPAEILATVEQIWERERGAYREALEAGSLVFAPDRLLLSVEKIRERLASYLQVVVGPVELERDSQPQEEIVLNSDDLAGLRPKIQSAGSADDPVEPLVELLRTWRRSDLRTFLVAARPGRARQLLHMLQARKVAVRVEDKPFELAWLEQSTPSLTARIVSGELPGGFICPSAGIALLPDSEIFGPIRERDLTRRAPRQMPNVKPGELVVHVDFGIGRFDGLVRMPVVGSEADFLMLSYRGGDRLYLPVTRMNLIERYQGPEGVVPPLSKLGGSAWQITKQRIHQALLEMADELVRMDAVRRARPGLTAPAPDEDYHALEASFPFDETDDQQRAIQEVLADVQQPRVMDRLLCGDVGFGKTEVAVRAAFLNTLSGRQTVVLVPTTVLALQHLSTFRRRLEPHGVRVEMLSRLVPARLQQTIRAQLAEGQVDVLIGTHRLLRGDIAFRKLGLLVIDEEHRFGVAHKEKLKRLKENVDVLTMTATPIPRTLQMALSGLRDISVIQTPPPGRRSIRTFITRFSTRVIGDAIRQELARGGQVFFLHNWVRSLPAMQRYLNRIVPEARTGVAHGQMPKHLLERVMTDFVQHTIDVLICTSIIESGLDIPTANTILVNRADHFGLAQLYQIRGRVGRSADRAYAYFLIPGLDTITRDARRRLEILMDASELGAGYRIASHDLELRGAGNLLGKAQSGQIAAVGFELYNRLLERAVMEVRGQKDTGQSDPEIQLPVAGYLPDDYVPDQDQRLELYSRLSRVASDAEVFEIEREMVDRFGATPDEVVTLCELMALKTQLRSAGVISLDAKEGRLNFTFGKNATIDPGSLVRLATEHNDRIAVDPTGMVQVKLQPEERRNPLPVARSFLEQLLNRSGGNR